MFSRFEDCVKMIPDCTWYDLSEGKCLRLVDEEAQNLEWSLIRGDVLSIKAIDRSWMTCTGAQHNSDEYKV